MIQTSPSMRILVAVAPVDFRRGIDGLAAICRQQLQRDPMNGWAFVFRNRRATAVKILMYDGQGFWLCQKRLSQRRFGWWPVADAAQGRFLQGHQLHVLLSGGNPEAAGGAPTWRAVAVAELRISGKAPCVTVGRVGRRWCV